MDAIGIMGPLWSNQRDSKERSDPGERGMLRRGRPGKRCQKDRPWYLSILLRADEVIW